MKIQSVAFFLVGFCTSLWCVEPSAFGAGDLDSPNPYGLTKSEKVLLHTKKTTEEVKSKTLQNEDSIESLRESLDGLKSVFEGTNLTIGKQKKRLSEVDVSLQENNQSIEKLTLEVGQLRNDLDALSKSASENFDSFKTIMSELSSLIDTINANYVSKEKYDADMKMVLEKLNSSAPKSTDAYEDMPGLELLDKAVEAYRLKEYSKSEAMFKSLIGKNYKPARSNFYLGEIYYYQKKYKDAIARYKESISLYDKASYTPTLLLHTGISFKMINDQANAKKFFDVLESNYPDSKEASLVQKYR